MAWSIGWDVPAQEPRFSDCSEAAKYLGVFDQQTLNLLLGWSGGLIFCSEDLGHHFYTLLQAHKKTSILAAENIPKRHRLRYPAMVPQQPHPAACVVWKTPHFILFCTHPTYTKPLCPSPSSPQTMQLLKEFLISKCPALAPESAHPHTHPRRSFTP